MHDHDDDTPWREPTPTFERPTGLGACRHAATASELRFRVQAPNSLPRDSTIVALDDGAAAVIEGIREALWSGARFLRLARRQPDVSPNEALLEGPDNGTVLASREIEGRDLVVLVATTAEGAGAAEILGRLARGRAIMTAGIVVGGEAAEPILRQMRSSAAVLVLASDADYVPAMLTALRA